MKANDIDVFDLKILTLLQASGRLTHQELSDLIYVPAIVCTGYFYQELSVHVCPR